MHFDWYMHILTGVTGFLCVVWDFKKGIPGKLVIVLCWADMKDLPDSPFIFYTHSECLLAFEKHICWQHIY